MIAGIKALVRNSGKETATRVAFPWLTNRLPVMGDPATSAIMVRRLSELHSQLGGNWLARLKKREAALTYDMQIGDSTLIEIDLVYKFSSSRMKSLDFYRGLTHDLDVNHYRSLCSEYNEIADRRGRTKETADFPFPGGRTAQAAYFDFAKDVLAPAHGMRVIRLPAARGEMTSAMALKLRMLL